MYWFSPWLMEESHAWCEVIPLSYGYLAPDHPLLPWHSNCYTAKPPTPHALLHSRSAHHMPLICEQPVTHIRKRNCTKLGKGDTASYLRPLKLPSCFGFPLKRVHLTDVACIMPLEPSMAWPGPRLRMPAPENAGEEWDGSSVVIKQPITHWVKDRQSSQNNHSSLSASRSFTVITERNKNQQSSNNIILVLALVWGTLPYHELCVLTAKLFPCLWATWMLPRRHRSSEILSVSSNPCYEQVVPTWPEYIKPCTLVHSKFPPWHWVDLPVQPWSCVPLLLAIERSGDLWNLPRRVPTVRLCPD